MAWSLAQSFASANNAGGQVNQAVTSNLTAGSKLIAYVGLNGPSASPTVTVNDGNGNNFTQVGSSVYNWTGTDFIANVILVLDTPSGDAGTKPTFNFIPTNSGGTAVILEEVTGLATGTTGSLDGGSVAFNHGDLAGAGNTVTPTYSSTAVNEYLASFYTDGWTSTALPSTPTGYTADANSWSGAGNGPNAIAAHKNSTNGSESVVWAVPAATHWVVALVAFKLPAAAPTSGPPLSSGMISRPVTVTGFAGRTGANHSR